MNLTAQEEADLLRTKSEMDWSNVCDRIKADRGGAYPPDWFKKVLVGGIMADAKIFWDK